MKYSVKVLILGIIILGTSKINGQDTKTYRVLFLGNSEYYSRGGVYPSFEGFCQTAGLDCQAVSQWNTPPIPLGIEFLDFGRIPVNLPEIAANDEIHAFIRSGKFDYVVFSAKRSGFILPEWVDLPEHRGQSIPYEKNLESYGKIHRTIVESGAKTVLYMEPGRPIFEDIKHPVAQFYYRLHKDLEEIKINGEQHKVIHVPALLLWVDAYRRYGEEGWYADIAHGNALARYASACMFYTYLTGKDPRKNEFKRLYELTRTWETIPEKTEFYATDEDAQWIKDQVWLYYTTRPR